jgi:hypothetical protein
VPAVLVFSSHISTDKRRWDLESPLTIISMCRCAFRNVSSGHIRANGVSRPERVLRLLSEATHAFESDVEDAKRLMGQWPELFGAKPLTLASVLGEGK